MANRRDQQQIRQDNEQMRLRLEQILLSSSQELSLILIRCSYQRLAQQIQTELWSQLSLQQLWFQPHSLFSLAYYGLHEATENVDTPGILQLSLTAQPINFEAILHQVFTDLATDEVASEHIQGMMICGFGQANLSRKNLESLKSCWKLFKNALNCPVMVWLSDWDWNTLLSFAPQLKDQAIASFEFVWDNPHLLSLWQEAEANCFQQLEEAGFLRYTGNAELNLAIGDRQRLELDSAHLALCQQGQSLPSFVSAFKAFLEGRDAYEQQQLHNAQAAFVESMNCYCDVTFAENWQQKLVDDNFTQLEHLPLEVKRRCAIVLSHLSLLSDEFPQTQSASSIGWQHGINCLRGSIHLWQQLEQWQGVIELTTSLGLVLRQCERFDELEKLAWHTIKCLHTDASQNLLTLHYEFLAAVALSNQNWQKAQILGQTALDSMASDRGANSERAWCFLTLALTEQHLGTRSRAISYCEQAKSYALAAFALTKQPSLPWMGLYFRLYIDIVTALRQLFWEAKNYRQAFNLLREQQQREQQWGWRIFWGSKPLPSGLLATNGQLRKHIQTILHISQRGQAAQSLFTQLHRHDSALTIVYGESGVGKTSLLQAGLLPELWGSWLDSCQVLPVMISSYSRGQKSLIKTIATARAELLHSEPQAVHSDPLSLLQENSQLNLLTVLIFDQFEQFLELYSQKSERIKFYQFLDTCLQLPLVKIILCLQKEYVHYLLEWDEYQASVNSLLDHSIRFHVGKFTGEVAQQLLTVLSELSPHPFEAKLIDRLVNDLSDEMSEVLPIELQVIGAQLQQEGITTLARYLDLGSPPKQILLERLLSQIIYQCGEQHRSLAWYFLFHLTNPRLGRPVVAKAEFVQLCQEHTLEQDLCHKVTELLLDIFVESEVVVCRGQREHKTYQLVHEYLVEPIRHHYQSFQSQRIAERLATQEQEVVQIRHHWGQAIATMFALTGVGMAMIFLARRAEFQSYQQWNVTQNAELMALSSSSDALLQSEQQFDALLESVRATVRLKGLLRQDAAAVNPQTTTKVLTTLERTYFALRESNRLEGHLNSVANVSISPDGQLLASAGWDNTVRLWSLEGKLLHVLEGHQERVTRVIFAPDGKSLYSGSWDGTVKRWSLGGKELSSVESGWQGLTNIDMSPDGRSLAIASEAGAGLQNLDGSAPNPFIENVAVYWIAFSPDGQEVVTVEDNNLVKLWDRQGNVRQKLIHPFQKALFATLSPDGNTLITTGVDGILVFWQRTSSQDPFQEVASQNLKAHDDAILWVEFSANGAYFATASADDTIKLWRRDGSLLETYAGHRDDVRSVSFYPDTQRLVSASMDKTVRIWAVGGQRRTTIQYNQPIRKIVFSPNGRKIATASEDNSIKIWQRNGTLDQVFADHSQRVNALAWHPDGDQLLTGGNDNVVRLWSSNGLLLKTLRGHQDSILDVEWSPDGALFASAGQDNSIKIWSKQGKLLQSIDQHRQRVNSLAFSYDSRLLASASDDQTIQIWQRRSDNSFFLASLLQNQDSWATDVSFSGDNQYLAASGYDNAIQLWQMQYRNGNPQFSDQMLLKGHSGSLANLSFNPRLQILATTTWNNQLQLWGLDDTLLTTFEGHSDQVTSVSWSPDGKAIATASKDNTAIIWELDLEYLLTKSCHWLNPYLRYNVKVRDEDRRLCRQYRNLPDASKTSSP